MPVEIRELIIRAVVSAETERGSDQPIGVNDNPNMDQEAMVQACVKQVLRILQKQQER